MKYTIRPGIIYRTIVDVHVLISSGEAAKICSPIQKINNGAAYYWKMLEQEMDTEEILDIAAAEFGIDKETLRPGFEGFLAGLEERNYIIRRESRQEYPSPLRAETR